MSHLLIIRKTGVKIIQGQGIRHSQEWHNYWIKLQTHFKKAATKKWQNAAIAMMDIANLGKRKELQPLALSGETQH